MSFQYFKKSFICSNNPYSATGILNYIIRQDSDGNQLQFFSNFNFEASLIRSLLSYNDVSIVLTHIMFYKERL